MPLQLRLIFLLVTLFLTFNYGWEFAIGGVIFLIVFNDSDYWLLLAGPILDLIFNFPFIFFTLSICAIFTLSSATKNFFTELNLSSFKLLMEKNSASGLKPIDLEFNHFGRKGD